MTKHDIILKEILSIDKTVSLSSGAKKLFKFDEILPYITDGELITSAIKSRLIDSDTCTKSGIISNLTNEQLSDIIHLADLNVADNYRHRIFSDEGETTQYGRTYDMESRDCDFIVNTMMPYFNDQFFTDVDISVIRTIISIGEECNDVSFMS